MPIRTNRDNSKNKSNRKATSLGLEQLESRLTNTISELQDAIQLLAQSPRSVGATQIVANQAPTVQNQARLTSGVDVTGTTATVTVRGKDDAGDANLKYTWRATEVPVGGSVRFALNGTGAAKDNRLTFTRAGTYQLQVTIADKLGLSTQSNLTVRVSQTASQLSIRSVGSGSLKEGGVVNSRGINQTLRAEILDQFGVPMSTQPTATWSKTSGPSGGQVTLLTNANAVTITVDRAGDYKLRAISGRLVANVVLRVTPTFSSVTVTPGTASVATGATQQFAGRALDQFQRPLVTQPTITWSATGGTIASNGLFRAGTSAGNFVVSATSGSISGRATITLTSAAPDNQSNGASLSQLLTTYYADGSITRTEMIQLLRSAGTDGRVDSGELTELRRITSSTSYSMPEYVRELARDVVNDNPANLKFQGQVAGNLVAGSSSSLLDKLIDKWFLGADVPTLTSASLTYQTSVGALFTSAPSLNDAHQGMLGDCYFIAGLVSIAQRDASAVRNLFVDNGDGTFTVRFFTGTYGWNFSSGSVSTGFQSGRGTADYVTVNRRLPTLSNGLLAYSGSGESALSSSTTLWIALAEKAYAQWNESGNAWRDGTNTYSGIEGGWMSDVYAQVLGRNATNYSFSSTPKQTLVDLLNAGRAVTLGTKSSVSNPGMVGAHAYTISGYNAANDSFTLHNPWGRNHPVPLTWSQIVMDATSFAVADAAGSLPINVLAVRSEESYSLAIVVSMPNGPCSSFSTDGTILHESLAQEFDQVDSNATAHPTELASASSPTDFSGSLEVSFDSEDALEDALRAALADLALSHTNLDEVLSVLNA